MEVIRFKRKIWMLIGIMVLLLLLLLRLSYIQLIATESFSGHQINLIKKSIQQRQQQLILDSGRGDISDRYGQVITGYSTNVLVLYPILNQIEVERLKMEEIAVRLEIPLEELSEKITKLREPMIYKQGNRYLHLSAEDVQFINDLQMTGVIALPYKLRYATSEIPAQHFLGYLGENAAYVRSEYAEELAQGILKENSVIGINGLEKAFQPFLQGIGPAALSYYIDAKGNLLPGMEIKYTDQENPFYPLELQTTLDLELQWEVESILDKYSVEHGTVVVLDTETSEILASSSRPNFIDQMHIDTSWENKAIKRYTPGSIFKIVTAAAALEEEIVKPKQEFECLGKLEGTDFHCWLAEGHGKLTFEEAFAKSCNIVFGQLAQQLGAEKLEEYAYKLGLIELNGWQTDSLFHYNNFKQLEAEEVGQVFAAARGMEEREDQSFLLQTGIGQLDVQASPLAVANMLATISKGGNKHQVRGVRDILYQTGGFFYHFPKERLGDDSISIFTAYQLQKLLAKVVHQGTAQKLNDKEWQASGKTGTAEISSIHGGTKHIHQWFAGYYPQQQPKYAIVVLSLYRPVGSASASMEIFSEVVDWLEQHR